MSKMHTREKRKLGLATNKSYNGQRELMGPKTFRNQEKARKWAKKHGISEPTIDKRGKKYVIQELPRTPYHSNKQLKYLA